MTDYNVKEVDFVDNQNERLEQEFERARNKTVRDQEQEQIKRRLQLKAKEEQNRREEQDAFQLEVVSMLQNLLVATRQTNVLLTMLTHYMEDLLLKKSKNLDLEKETLNNLNQYLADWK